MPIRIKIRISNFAEFAAAACTPPFNEPLSKAWTRLLIPLEKNCFASAKLNSGLN